MPITDPRDIPGLVAWYSADAETAYADGAAMTGWTDLSGNGNHTASATGGPAWQASTGSAGGPAVKFGANKYFTLPNILASATAGEIMATLKATATTSQQAHWKFGTCTIDPQNHYTFSDGRIYEDFGNVVRRNFAPTLSPASWRRYNVWSAANDWAALLDETSQHTQSSNTVTWNTAPKIGGGGSPSVDLWYGCVLVFNRKLTTTERADLAAWLAAHPSGGTTASGPTASGSGVSEAAATGTTTAAAQIDATATAIADSSATAQANTPATGVRTNRAGGRRRSGLATATWEPSVTPPPDGMLLATAYDTANAFGPVTMDGTQPTYSVSTARTSRHRDRIVVGGVDITYFRGIAIPLPTIQLVAPLLYGPATLVVPQVAACFERLGVGDLKWLKKGKKVKVQRVDANGAVAATDYKGVIVAFDTSGRDLTIQIGGEASGRAALRNRQIPLFRSVHDIGRYAFRAIHELGLPFKPRLGPVTGIEVANFGGTSHLDYINQLCAKAWTKAGNQFTVMPDGQGAYRMARKDTTTIHGTVYLDDARTVGKLRRDVAEEPNRIYGTGVTPDGQRVRFGVYPGLKQTVAPPYPMADNSMFGQGTTDAMTSTGDGVTVMIGRLQVVGYLTRRQSPGGYDAGVTKAIEALQDEAGLAVTGNMGPNTWRALYDLGATGYSLAWSHIEPAAQKARVREWNRSGSGAIMSRNPDYEPAALVVDRNVDFGTGFERGQMKEWARTELDHSEDNWVGTIDFHTGALVAGNHTPGDPITEADVMAARDLRPGMNLSAPLFDGGITLHVAGITVTSDGHVQATVDTRARDTLPVWEVIRRNRESRQDPARAWLRDHRASTQIKDALIEWDEVGGILGDPIDLPAYTWVVIPVVAGQEGVVRALRMDLTPAAEYVVAVFGRKITPGRLRRLVGNPLTKAGAKRWAKEATRDALDEKNILLYAAGDNENPCGYYPKQKTAEGDQTGGTDEAPTSAPAAPLTGRWEDDAGFSYHTGEDPVLYVAVYADRATTLPAGRIMWNQLEAGA